jgi:hypothetical protein
MGGWKPEVFSSTLSVEQGRLLGWRGRHSREISPEEILELNEYGGNHPFLLVTTAGGKFHVGLMARQYDDVVRVLEQGIGSDFSRRLVHRWNVFWYRKQFSVGSILRTLFHRGRKKDQRR